MIEVLDFNYINYFVFLNYMDYLREKVSGKKNRLKQGNFNLDLTYITKRIIAMSMPGEGIQGIYRNPID